MNSDRECYTIASDGFAWGPYRSETAARILRNQGETVMWLDPHEDIDQFGYIKTQEDTK